MGPRLRVPPELADPVGAIEVGEHEDVEQLGTRGRAEGVIVEPSGRTGRQGQRLLDGCLIGRLPTTSRHAGRTAVPR
jgi:hypothetical protein